MEKIMKKDDTISRQAAIDVLEERLQANGYTNVALVSELNRSIGYLRRLPSAQPTQCNSSNILQHPQCANRTKLGNCDPVGGFCTSVSKEICDAQEHEKENITDTISRKAAIEAIFNEPLCESGMKERTAIAVVLAIYEKIKSLPSAQPEIIRCKDCKYGDTFHEFDDPEMPMKCIGHHYGGTYPDDFCSYAERKTYE